MSTKFDPLNEQRKRNKNQIEIQDIPMNSIKLFLTTARGWVLRKGSELATVAGAAVAGYVAGGAHHVGATAEQAAQASSDAQSLTALAVGLVVKIGFDWLVSKVSADANKALPPPAK